MQQNKKFLKGEKIFKEGEQPDKIFLIQNGKISLFVERGKSKIEIIQLNAPQIVGTLGAFFNQKHSFSSEAIINSNVIEMSLETFKEKLYNSPNVQKLVFKSMAEEIKSALSTIRSLKLEKDSNPCPQIFIPRLFGAINFITRYLGKKENDKIIISWSNLRTYTTRMFLEAPNRVENVLLILQKLNIAKINKIINEEEEEEITTIEIFDIDLIEKFADFYQFYLYKAGKSELIYFDPFIFPRLEGIVDFSKDKEKNFKGYVKLEFNLLSEYIEKKYKTNLKLDHIAFFERKGLFIQRAIEENITYWYLDREEFVNVYNCWKIIKEINKWNELGYIKLQDQEEDIDQNDQENINKCSKCNSTIKDKANFCPNCGNKIT